MEILLKPCPFCGSTRVRVMYSEINKAHIVFCTNCKASSNVAARKEDAIYLWNKRAEPEEKWIPCSERLPECEQEVLICTKQTVYASRSSGYTFTEEMIVTPALYEDGTMLEVNSKWRWEDIDWAGWDEEEDCGIIPEGWWENRHFNPDDVYNNVVDKEVIAWMPLPEPYKEGEQ